MKQQTNEELRPVPSHPSGAAHPGLGYGARLWAGLIGVAFFGLAMLGLLLSSDKRELLIPGILILALLLGSVRLLYRGVSGLRALHRQKHSETAAPVSAWAAAPEEWEESRAVVCPNCGATGAPDENNCCAYCGSRQY